MAKVIEMLELKPRFCIFLCPVTCKHCLEDNGDYHCTKPKTNWIVPTPGKTCPNYAGGNEP